MASRFSFPPSPFDSDVARPGPGRVREIEVLQRHAQRGRSYATLRLSQHLIANLVWSVQLAPFDPERAAAYAALAEKIEVHLAERGFAVTFDAPLVPLAWLQTALVGDITGS